MLSKYDYYCTNCDFKLSEGSEVHFLVSIGASDLQPLRLIKVPGTYGHRSEHSLEIKEGDKVNFFCVRCKENLQSKTKPEFIEISLRVKDSLDFKLFFSPICGDKTTYILLDGELTRYGNDFFSIGTSNSKNDKISG